MSRRSLGLIAAPVLMLAQVVATRGFAQAKKKTGHVRVEPTTVHVRGPTIVGFVPGVVADAADLEDGDNEFDDDDPKNARWDFSKATSLAVRCLESAGKHVRVEFVVDTPLVIEQLDKASEMPLPKTWPRSMGAYLVDVDRNPCLVTSGLGAHGLTHDLPTAAGEYFGVASCLDDISPRGSCEGPEPTPHVTTAPATPSERRGPRWDGGANDSVTRAASNAPAPRDAGRPESIAVCATAEECREKGYNLYYGRVGCQLFVNPQDTEAARPYFAAGCDKGDAFSCQEVASIAFQDGTGTRDAAIQRACDLGRLSNCDHFLPLKLGRKGKARADEASKKAAALAQRLCDDGLDTGCRFAADYYETGFGVQKDAKRAAALRRRARLLGAWELTHPDEWVDRPCQ